MAGHFSAMVCCRSSFEFREIVQVADTKTTSSEQKKKKAGGLVSNADEAG